MMEMFGRWAQAPDLIEPIVAYRGWAYFADDRVVRLFALSLRSYGGIVGNEWDDAWRQWVKAWCHVHPNGHDAPREGCSCGFYALKSPADAASLTLERYPGSSAFIERQGRVLGRVQLAGKVIEHESGYRAERARIAALIPTTSDGGIARWLAPRLNLPVAPELDTSPLMDTLEPRKPFIPTRRARPLRPDERRRLKTHQRHFHLIQGGEDTSLN